jgi:glucosamine--fructose-6-phosphate aminotransferase (isomerizing)
MCGIVGYIGKQTAVPLLLEGLRRLEYRGYDSAGLCTIDGGEFQMRKKKGRIDVLASLIEDLPVEGSIGISHTRWATHGAPSDANSHPHFDASGKIAIVHNGIIENYRELKDAMVKEGHTFRSETDTEILAHLIGKHYEKNGRTGEAALLEALRQALGEVDGTYGIAMLCTDCPDVMIGARCGSPLIVGVGKGENFLASDVNALVAHTRNVVYLQDHDIAVVRADRFEVSRLDNRAARYQISKVEHDAGAVEKGGYAHFMLKEIFEQPQVVRSAMRGRFKRDESLVVLDGLNMSNVELLNVDRIVMTACGTSWHAALVGEYIIEHLARIPCEVEYASELRYRNPPMERNTVLFAITQSGETADTLAAIREARRRGHKTFGICNVVGSTIARESDGAIYLHAGPEIGVASTKAFTCQVTVLTLLALGLARLNRISSLQGVQFYDELAAIPDKIATILKQNDAIRAIAARYKDAQDFLYLGRQFNFPVALEGALKLKEISYAHAEGYPAAEMKHGPIALVDSRTPSVFICPRDALYDKTLSNVEEVKARSGPIIAIATEGDDKITQKANDVIYVPPTIDPLYPLLTNVPLQLFAYHMAVHRGCDVDKPRNLAKSVTVE